MDIDKLKSFIKGRLVQERRFSDTKDIVIRLPNKLGEFFTENPEIDAAKIVTDTALNENTMVVEIEINLSRIKFSEIYI